jgi:hypothetical protein
MADEKTSPPAMARAVAHLQQGDWQAAHLIVQDDQAPLACWAHGIVHLMEGDDDNAGYWYRRAERLLDRQRLRDDRQAYLDAERAALASAL